MFTMFSPCFLARFPYNESGKNWRPGTDSQEEVSGIWAPAEIDMEIKKKDALIRWWDLEMVNG